jgi:urate oxidase
MAVKKEFEGFSLVDFFKELEVSAWVNKVLYDSEEHKSDKWIEEYTKQANEPNLSKAEKQVGLAHVEVEKDRKAKKLQEVREAYLVRANEIREAFSEYLDNEFANTPERLDSDAIRLLDIGIMSPKEYKRMFDDYSDNPCMMRIVAKYAEKKLESEEGTISREGREMLQGIIYAVNVLGNGERQLENFDNLSEIGGRMVGTGVAAQFAKVQRDNYAKTFIANLSQIVPFEEIDDPASDGNNKGKKLTKADIMNIRDAAERQEAIAKNWSLFV